MARNMSDLLIKQQSKLFVYIAMTRTILDETHRPRNVYFDISYTKNLISSLPPKFEDPKRKMR